MAASNYWYSRFVFERALGLIYLVAFLNAANQFVPLLGEQGLVPFTRYVQFVPFSSSPSLFYFLRHDGWLRLAAWLGVVLAIAVVTALPQRGGAMWAAAVW